MKINFYERFLKLCELNGIKPTPVLKKIGLSTGNLKKWQNESTKVTLGTIEKMANYFDVPIDYFLSDNAECRQVEAKIEMESVILDEIEAVQALMTQCEKTLNRLETTYKNLGNRKEA